MVFIVYQFNEFSPPKPSAALHWQYRMHGQTFSNPNVYTYEDKRCDTSNLRNTRKTKRPKAQKFLTETKQTNSTDSSLKHNTKRKAKAETLTRSVASAVGGNSQFLVVLMVGEATF